MGESYEFAWRFSRSLVRSVVGLSGAFIGGVGLFAALPGNLLWRVGRAMMEWANP